jgi:RimJ/RimL family protein N-acetyltransferase
MYPCLKKASYTYEKLDFQLLQSKDMEPIRIWRNSQIDILRQQKPLTEEEQQNYFAKTLLPSFIEAKPDQILLAIRKNEILIGYAGLTHIDWGKKCAEFSFLLDTAIEESSELFQSCYFATVDLFSTIAFQELCFKKMTAEVYIFRTGMIQLLERAGFHQTGRLRNHVFKRGKAWDALQYESRSDHFKA